MAVFVPAVIMPILNKTQGCENGTLDAVGTFFGWIVIVLFILFTLCVLILYIKK